MTTVILLPFILLQIFFFPQISFGNSRIDEIVRLFQEQVPKNEKIEKQCSINRVNDLKNAIHISFDSVPLEKLVKELESCTKK